MDSSEALRSDPAGLEDGWLSHERAAARDAGRSRESSAPSRLSRRDMARGEILEITADLRNGLEDLLLDVGDRASFEAIQKSTVVLADAARWCGAETLERGARMLERMATIGSILAVPSASKSEEMFDAMLDGVGCFERMVDWCLEGSDRDQERLLLDGMLGLCPGRWRPSVAGKGPASKASDDALTWLVLGAKAEEIPPARAETASETMRRELVEPFRLESAERLHRCEELVVALEREPGSRILVDDLFRQFHTLKGAAAAVGLDEAAMQLHAAEWVLDGLREGKARPEAAELGDFLLGVIDATRGLVTEFLHAPRVEPARCRSAGESDVELDPTAPDETASAQRSAKARELIAQAESLSKNREEMRQQIALLGRLRDRAASPSSDERIRRLLDSVENEVDRVAQMARGLEDQIRELCLVPIESVFGRLRRPARDAARQEGKSVELEVQGGGLWVDRRVGERLCGVLLHCVRNAVSHGIETPEVRAKRSKPVDGRISLTATEQAGGLLVRVEDDGAGLNYEAIRARALACGLIRARQFASRAELGELIFAPGFSTRDRVSELAGRGVGMDAVARDISELGGTVDVSSVDVSSVDGAGTCFLLRVPGAAAGLSRADARRAVAAAG